MNFKNFFSTDGPITAKDYIKLLVGVLIWGTAYVVIRSIALVMDPMALAFCRVSATALFFLPLALLQKTPLKEVWAARFYLLGMGVLGSALFMALMCYGLFNSMATNGALINATYPLVAVLVSAVILKTRIKKYAILPLCLAVIGTVILVISKPGASGGGFVLGDIAFAINVFIWSIFSILFIPFNNRLPAVTWAFWANLIGAILLIPVMLWEGYDFSQISPAIVLKLIYVGVFCGGLATILWGQCVSRLGMATAALFNNINPLFAVILAGLFLGEALSSRQIVGGIILMAAVAFYSVRDYRNQKIEQAQALKRSA